MQKTISLAALAFCLISGSAHAATLDIILGLTPGSVSYSVSATPVVQNVDLSNPGPNTLTRDNNSVLLPQGFVDNSFAKPPLGTTGDYLAVTESFHHHTGSSVFTISDSSQFGFTWSTVDTYNTLTIKDSRNDTYVITGNDVSKNPPLSASILNALYPTGFVGGASQVTVEITDPFGKIVTARFQSSTNSFEVGGFSVGSSATPLPPALPLFVAGILALASFAYWRRRSDRA